MKVATATQAMIGWFKPIYPDIFDLSQNKRETELDLLIFTGGEDLNPELYGEISNGAMGWNDARDSMEIDIFNSWVRGELKCKRILGICRGLQFLNVMLGGTLYQDMDHPGIHPMQWKFGHPLDFLSVVNSLHHQAVRYVGERHSPMVLATEPNTRIPEVISWGMDVLGVQFHPEMFGSENRTKFFSIVDEWVAGKVKFNIRGTLSGRLMSTTSSNITVMENGSDLREFHVLDFPEDENHEDEDDGDEEDDDE